MYRRRGRVRRSQRGTGAVQLAGLRQHPGQHCEVVPAQADGVAPLAQRHRLAQGRRGGDEVPAHLADHATQAGPAGDQAGLTDLGGAAVPFVSR